MRFSTILLTTFLAFCSQMNLNAQSTWQRIYPHDFGSSIGRDVQPTADGGFIFVGEIDFPTGAIRHYVRLIKVDPQGNTQWEKIYHENEPIYEAGYSVRVNDAGEYIVGGTSQYDVLLMRIASNGDTIFTKTYGQQSIDRCEAVRFMPNGDYLLGCGAAGFDTDAPYVMRTTAGGTELWQSWFGVAPIGGMGVTDLEVVDSNQIVVISNDGQTQLTGIDGSGSELWNASFQFTKMDMIPSFVMTGDGKFALSGIGSGFAGYSPLLTSATSAETQDWYAGADPNNFMMSSVELIPDGNLITGMYDWLGFPPAGLVYIKKYEHTGNLLWTKSYPGDNYPFHVYPLADGGFIACGTLNGQMMLIRTDANGDIIPTGTKNPDLKELVLYPNPAADFLNIEIPEIGEKNKTLRLSSVDGRILENVEIDDNKYTLNTQNYLPGTYLLSVFDKNKVYFNKTFTIIK